MSDTLPTSLDLDDIALQVWSAFLDDETEVVPSPEPGDERSDVAASVGIVGAFEGHVIIKCSTDASRDVAAVLFQMEAAEITSDEVGDALGELANVLGGNIKSMLPTPSTMSLPHVASTTHNHWPGTAEVCRTVVNWRGNPFTLILLTSREHDRLERVVA